MKKFLTVVATASLLAGCCSDHNKIEIKEANALAIAAEKSVELATKVIEAKSYEEFCAAREELEAYEEAFRTQIGGEEYELFMTQCNEILSNI